MLKRLIIIAALTIIFTMLKTEANAGCIDLGGGSLYCAEWIPGSEICKLTTTGGITTPKNSSARCEVDPVPVSYGYGSYGAGSTLTGTLVCKKATGGGGNGGGGGDITITANQQGCKAHHFNGLGTGHENHDECIITNAIISSDDVDFPLFAQTRPGGLNCNSRGVCKTSLEVEIPQADGNAICASEGLGRFVSFIANSFLATATICEGGSFYSNGECGGESGPPEHVIQEICTLSETGKTYGCEPFGE